MNKLLITIKLNSLAIIFGVDAILLKISEILFSFLENLKKPVKKQNVENSGENG